MKKIALSTFLLAASGLAVSPASAQDQDPAQLSIAAGYKAAFTCSAHFNAGRSLDQIAGDELNRIYPDYRDALASLPDAVVDEKKKRVSVIYADGAPPRIAQWRDKLGCAQLPTGADARAAKHLPTVVLAEAARDESAIWPASRESVPAPAAVKAAADRAFDAKTYGDGTETTAVLVVKDGDILFERYRDGFDAETSQRTWSVAKSIAATVIGAAVHQGLIEVDKPAGLAVWSSPGDPRAKITLADLLHMSSGLDAGPAGNRTDDVYFGGGRVIDHAMSRRLVAAPGTRWYYANNDTMLAMRALRERMDDDSAYLEFPFRTVTGPLGMSDTYLETDWNGDFVMSSQVWTTARDLARLGLLYLADGVWAGERILPKDWSAFVARPAPDQPGPRANGEARPGYGAQFWLFDERHDLPAGTYAAMGNRGQYLVIVPERNMLIIRRGFDDNGGARFDIAAFARDVLKAAAQ
ncbi:MAG: serine hydrolase [Pseudomonadota bacterium]